MRQPIKLAVGALGGVVVAIGVVVITASAVGFNLSDALQPAPSPATQAVTVPSPSPSPGRAQVNPAARAVTLAVLQAEAQALGVRQRDLTLSLRQGTTPHQLATQRGISPASFQALYRRALTAILDQDVQQGSLTAQQEQLALSRLGSQLPPNWDQVAAGRQQ
jgi:hypothetical protein